MISRLKDSPFVRTLAFAALGCGQVLTRRMARISSAQVLTILNLHRVHASSSSTYEALAPDLFEDLLRFAKAHFDIVTFGDIARQRKSTRPQLILSFDDGYKDFVQYAAPLLQKHGIRANQNIVPASILSGLPPMNVVLQDFIGIAPLKLLRELDLSWIGVPVNLERRVASGIQASRVFKNKPIAEQKCLFEQLWPQFHRDDNFRPTEIMNLDDVRELTGQHEIGVQSYEHATMTFESQEYFEEDLVRCQAFFRDNLSQDIKIYAFPNGEYRQENVDHLVKAGMRDILLVGERFSQAGARLHHRFTLRGRSAGEVRFRALGGACRIE